MILWWCYDEARRSQEEDGDDVDYEGGADGDQVIHATAGWSSGQDEDVVAVDGKMQQDGLMLKSEQYRPRRKDAFY